MNSDLQRVRIKVFGDVHYVGFRFSTIEIARDLGLTGWVKNEPGGTVQIIAEGEREKLENLVAWARKGPSLARVEKIDVEWGGATGEISSFDVSY
jgi:acylphosphatase